MTIRAVPGVPGPLPPDPAAQRRWVRALCRRYEDVPALTLVAAVVERSALALGGALAGFSDPAPDLAGAQPPPGGWGDPWLVGAVHELAATAAARRARGAWYTPRTVVEGLVAVALPGVGAGPGQSEPPEHLDWSVPRPDGRAEPLPDRVIDPTCGGGAFLLAALDRLVACGLGPEAALGRVAGLDLDPGAVNVTRWALQLWWLARTGGTAGPCPPLDVHQGDALAPTAPPALAPLEAGERRAPVPAPPSTGRWLVVGNPPFATPLRAGVVPEPAARYRAERADLLGPYADLGAIHLLRAVETAPPGSTVALVQPQSTLSGRDTEGLRAHLEAAAPVRALWACREPVFDAGVRACAPVLAVGAGPAAEIELYDGPAVRPVRRQRRQAWGPLAADALGAPELPALAGRLGDLVTATAGFRDEHYGLVAACREAAAGEEADGARTARLVTVGAVDLLWTAWGGAPVRFGGQTRTRPLIDREALEPKVQRWLDRQLQPKVLLATQTKLLEPYVDRAGVVAPATPLIAVHAPADLLDRVTAVLLAPPVALWAWRRWFGTALSIDALKLAARQVAELPLPADEAAWAEAAALVAGADGADRAGAEAVARSVAAIMTAAYGAGPAVLSWWTRRLPQVTAPGR